MREPVSAARNRTAMLTATMTDGRKWVSTANTSPAASTSGTCTPRASSGCRRISIRAPATTKHPTNASAR